MSQVFKTIVPKSLLYEFLSKNCSSQKQFFIFNSDAFKKVVYNGTLVVFLEACKPFYFHSKQRYLQNITYNGIITVLRQICNINKIAYSSKVKYAHSTYIIEYYIQEDI